MSDRPRWALIGTVVIAIGAVVVLCCGGVFTVFISSSQLYTLPLGLTTFVLPNRSAWDLIMAGSVLATIPLFVIFFVFQRQFVRGISLSGLKG